MGRGRVRGCILDFLNFVLALISTCRVRVWDRSIFCSDFKKKRKISDQTSFSLAQRGGGGGRLDSSRWGVGGVERDIVRDGPALATKGCDSRGGGGAGQGAAFELSRFFGGPLHKGKQGPAGLVLSDHLHPPPKSWKANRPCLGMRQWQSSYGCIAQDGGGGLRTFLC